MKNVLVLTAGFGEGHNAAARGIRDALLQIAPETRIDVRDLFAEVLGPLNQISRRAYIAAINRLPRAWSSIYSWIDRRKQFRSGLRLLFPVRQRLEQIISARQPDVIVSVYPAYPHLLDEIYGAAKKGRPRRVVCITDSITVNAIWFRCSADCFLVANDQTADVLVNAGAARELVRVFGFPVSPEFASLANEQGRSPISPWTVFYMLHPGKTGAADLVRQLADMPDTNLLVSVGREESLWREIEAIRSLSRQKFEVIGWTTELPRLLSKAHLLITKAGGATIQEAIAAQCPMIINQIVPGQEAGNAQLVLETNCGAVAINNDEVIAAVQRATADDGKLLREWSANIARISRPDASLQIAEFLLQL